MEFFRTQLDNGLEIIAELNTAAQSVAAGFFVRTGARDETEDVSGVSHFLEHMAFKGNEQLTADDVNRMFDELGAHYNASTSEEITLYYAAMLPEYLSETFRLLAALIQPSLRKEDFDVEKNVILEEIGMYADQPGFTAYEKSMAEHFIGHPLGRPILGSTESITALSVEQMRAWHNRQYCAGNITLAVAGNVDHSSVVDLAREYCSAWPAGATDRPIDEARPAGSVSIVTKESGVQQHVMQLTAAPSATNELRYAAQLLSGIVGDDSGSRLFWEFVDPGHAEAAELGFNEYEGNGTWLTYLSCHPEQTRDNLQRIAALYDDVNRNGITEAELQQARNKAAARVVLRSERPMGRLSSLGGNWLYLGEYRSVEDDLREIERISMDDIRRLRSDYPLGSTTTVTIGPLSSLK